jgi:hypothetical protein
MYQEELENMIDLWEPTGCEVVRCIDTYEDTVERIVKFTTHRAGEELYSLYRYFTIGDTPNVLVSVDLKDVDADTIIQELGERL